MISQDERKSILRPHSIGPAMIDPREEIGIERLADLRGADAAELAMRCTMARGACPHLAKQWGVARTVR